MPIKFLTLSNHSFIRAWLIWGLAVLFYFYENILQVSPGVMASELMRDLNINALAYGNLAAFYFYALAPSQIPAGLLLDLYGPRKLLTVAMMIVICGSYLFAQASGLFVAQIGRFLIGAGSAYAAISCMKLASTWFPLQRFALLTGLMITIGFSGSIFGQKPLAILVGQYGWRGSMMLFVYTGILLSLMIWLVVRDSPSMLTKRSDVQTNSPITQTLSGLRIIFAKCQPWLVAIYGGLMFAPTSIVAIWGVPYLRAAYLLDKSDAAGICLYLFVGWIVGGPITGWISDAIKRRKITFWFGSLGALLTISILLYYPNLSRNELKSLLFCFGFCSSGFLPAFSVIREICPQHLSATALGFMNMFNMVGGAVGLPIVGYYLDLNWDGLTGGGIRLYSLENYQHALSILPLLIALSLMILPFLKETYCQSAAGDELVELPESV